MNHTKVNLTILTSVFVLLLFAPVIKSLIKPGHSHPMLEKRRLKHKPETPVSTASIKAFPEAFESYYKDNFEFRYEWLHSYKLIKLAINDPADKKVIFGTETGWLFFNDRAVNDVVGDFRNINQFSQDYLNSFIGYLQAKQQWLAEQGIEYLFVLAPSKHYIYPEYLPKKYQPIEQINLKTQLSQSLKKHPEINFLDLTQSIIDGKSQQKMFLKNDTHWSDYATNLAQFALSQKLAILFPNKIKPFKKPWSEFKDKQLHTGDLEQINGLIGEFPDYRYLPKFKSCAEKLTPPKVQTMSTFSTDCEQPLRTLIYRDSFFSNLQPFVSEQLGLSRFVWTKMTFENSKVHIKEINPHVVIEEWVDRHLPHSGKP